MAAGNRRENRNEENANEILSDENTEYGVCEFALYLLFFECFDNARGTGDRKCGARVKAGQLGPAEVLARHVAEPDQGAALKDRDKTCRWPDAYQFRQTELDSQ